MISENNLLPLNDTEHFLKNFLKKFPVYQTKIINPLANEQDYIYLLHLLEAEWHKQLPDQTFFLTGSSGHLSEDFFISDFSKCLYFEKSEIYATADAFPSVY